MSGNEYGERIHNFFGQENLSQDQRRPQVGDGNWPGFSNGLLVNTQRQLGSPFDSNLKHFSAQQTVESERGQSSAQHGFNFTQSALGHEFSRTHSQNHPPNLNGYTHDNQVFQRMQNQNEANFLGVDTESDRHRLTSKGGHLQKNSMRLERSESPVNYDFFGGQQQISRDFPGAHQSLPRQQSGFVDMQLLQQQMMLKQMQDIQMQQQLAQMEAREFSSINHDAVNGNMMNGFLDHSASNNPWQPEVMTSSASWLQRGLSPVGQGSSTGLMFSVDQGQVNLVASTSQQFQQSLYGVPISSSKGSPNTVSSVQTLQSNNLFPANQHAAFSNDASKQDNSLLSRSGYQEKLVSSHTSVEALNNGPNSETYQHHHQINIPECERGGRREVVDPSKKSFEKMVNVISPHNASSLDPTEEKILYGSDDNIWDAFGSSINMSSDSSIPGGSDPFCTFPSLQSGSWSALMQSAVAEASSGDTARDISSAKAQPCVVQDSGKQQSAWVGNKMIQADSSLNSRGFSLLDTSYTGIMSPSVLGSQESGSKTSNAQSEGLHVDASQLVVQKFQEEGTKSSDHSVLEKSLPHSQRAGNNSHTLSVGSNLENVFRTDQLNVCAYGTDERRSVLLDSMDGGNGNLPSNLAVSMEQKKCSPNFPQILQEGSDLTSGTAAYGSRMFRERHENSQQHLNSHNENSVNRLNKGTVDMHEAENSTKKNSNENFFSSISPQPSGIRPNATESSTLPGGKQKASGHVGRRPPISRKFQYHPMGNIDVVEEPSFGEKLMHSQSSFQQASGGNQRYIGQSKGVGQMAKKTEPDKGLPFRGELKPTEYISHKGLQPDCATGASASDTSGNKDFRARAGSSSQTMLELFHKTDQSQERGFGTHSGASDQNRSSGPPERKTSGEHGILLQHNQSSASQGFNLQLAPPSQRFLASDYVLSSQNSEQADNSSQSHSNHLTRDIGIKNQSVLTPRIAMQGLPNREMSQGTFDAHDNSGQTRDSASRHDLQGDSSDFISGLSHAKGDPLLTQRFSSQPNQRGDFSGRAQNSLSAPIPSHQTSKHDQACVNSSQLNSSTFNDKRDPARVFPVLEAMPPQSNVASTIGQQSPSLNIKMSDSWANVHSDNKPEGSSSGNDTTGKKTTDRLQLREKEVAAHHPSESSFLVPRIAQSDFRTSNRSSAPDHIWNGKNRGPNHAHPVINAEDDLANRNMKIVNGSDGVSDPHQSGSRGGQLSSPGFDGLIRDGSSSGDSKRLGFSSKIRDDECKAFPHDMLPSNKNVSQSSSSGSLATSVETKRLHISPQMAPMWFNHFGSLKNGQVMPFTDSQQSAPLKLAEQSCISGRFDSLISSQAQKQANAVDSSQPGIVSVSSNTITRPPEPLPSVQSLPHDGTGQSSEAVRPMKRKTSTCELSSWDREVVQCTHSPLAISDAEVKWARTTSRIAEKLEGVESIYDGPPVLKSKRRLTLTTQLMQQLLHPPMTVASSDASLNCETGAYTVARAVLGDACSMLASAISPLGSNADRDIVKALEDFINRSNKLETDFSRLGNGTSISDLRLEIQDIEKFAVINRFARFHARGQLDGAETSSFSATGTNTVKVNPQRYVSALPMPRNVPDRVQCLSL